MEIVTQVFVCDCCYESGVRNASFLCHSICNYCILSKSLPAINRSPEEYFEVLSSKLICPICQEPSINNAIYREFLENEKIFLVRTQVLNKKCESCLIDQVEVYCNTCEIFYCKECILTKHYPIKSFRIHSLNSNIDNLSNSNICRCLKDRKIQFVCNSCDDYFCINCIILDHHDHNYNTNHIPYNVLQEEQSTDMKELKLLKASTNKKRLSLLREKLLAYSTIPSNTHSTFKNLLGEFISFLERIETSTGDFSYLVDDEFVQSFIKDMEIFQNYYSNSLCKLEDTLKSVESNIFAASDMSENLKNLMDGKLHPKLEVRTFAPVVVDYIKDKLSESEANTCISIKSEFYSISNKIMPPELNSEKINGPKLKLVFKGQAIRKLKGQNIAVSSRMSNDSFPNMFVVFKNYEGKSFVGWINSFNQIELFDFSSGEPYQNQHMNTSSLNLTFKDSNSKLFDANNLSISTIKDKSSLCFSASQKNKANQGSTPKTINSRFLKLGNSSKKDNISIQRSASKSRNTKEVTANQTMNKSMNLSVIDSKKHVINAHSDTVYCLRHYVIDREHFLLTGSKDNYVKLWECKFFSECFCVNNNANVRSGVIVKFKNVRYIVVCSYTKDYPINAYDSQGVLCRQFAVNGYSYHLDSYEHANRIFLFNSTYPYLLNIYDFESCNVLYCYKTASYINSIVITPFHIPLATLLDRTGCMTQINLDTGEILREHQDVGYYGMCKWNERFFIVCGKGLGFNIIDINSFTTVDWYNDLHKDSIRSVMKYRHPDFGDVLLTYGEDQIIKMYK